jgi:hypothetical protein
MKYFYLPIFSRKKSARLGTVLLVFGLISFLFMRCGTEDMEFLDPFELSFQNKFDNLITPFQITETEPVVTAPPIASVTVPEEVTTMLTGIAGARTSQEVKTAMAPASNSLDTYLAQASPESKAQLASMEHALNMSLLNNLKAGTVNLSPGSVLLLENALKNSEFSKFLPRMVLPAISGRLLSGKVEDPLRGESARTLDLVGSCREKANEAYQLELDKLKAAKTAAEAPIQANFTSRNQEVTSRFNARNAEALARLNQRWDAVYLAFALFQSQYQLMDSLQRQYFVFYIYTYVYVIQQAYERDLALNAQFRAKEALDVSNLRASSLATLANWYAAQKAKLDQALKTILNSCHNQGSGA